ncbi:MAG: hypothetical protein QOE36_2510 [Gaiellaceae bacterium]|nr:hypothetical protein [Gaiellaceae bacterium]
MVVLALALAGSARAGGTPRGYVLLPAEGRVALVDLQAGRVLKTVAVPRGAGPLVASIDGSRVLVANTRTGVVTEINGISGRRARMFVGLGRPTELALIPRTAVGYVRPRYAIVLDARGWIAILDLDRGRVVERAAVANPVRMALAEDQLWVASGRSARLTQFDVSEPARLRRLARPTIGGTPTALAPDPAGSADVNAALGDGRLVRVDAVSLSTRIIGRIPGRVTQLLAGYGGVLWAVEAGGTVLGVRLRDGHIVSATHAPARSRFTIVGGWLVATYDDSLRMIAPGTRRGGTTTTLPGAAGAFSFAVLP